MINKYFILVVIVWVGLWINFLARDLFIKKDIDEYRALVQRNNEEKRSYVYGESFYELIRLAKDNIPENSTFGFKGIEKNSISHRRGLYYLYPRIESENPDYIIVSSEGISVPSAYTKLLEIDRKRYILVKR